VLFRSGQNTTKEVENPHTHEIYTISSNDATFGTCRHVYDYDLGFAFAFIFTRVVLVLMYVMYFYVFHESNLVGHAPDIGIRISEADLEEAAEEVARKISVESAGSGTYSGNGTVNPLAVRPSALHTEDLIRDLHAQNRESVVQRHFTSIAWLKITPAIISSIIMLGAVKEGAMGFVLPIVAAVEFSSDFIASFFPLSDADWKKLTINRHFAMERLGLFFMAVLGEAVLGLAVDSVEATDTPNFGRVYTVIL
jgi:hypothetical protein